MSDPNVYDLIGVDGGGTSCRFALKRGGERFDITLNGANVTSDRDGALATIRRGLDQVLAKAGLLPDALEQCHVYMGLAGIMSDTDSVAVMRAFKAGQIAVFDDRELALNGALADADGAIASVGTGSFVGRRANGVTRYVGGWGLVLDDAASGAWLGRSAFRDTLRAQDGFHSTSPLTRSILDEFDNSTADLVGFSHGASPAEFARYAPRVVDLAANGDAVALNLMQTGATYLCQSLTVLGWKSTEPLCLTGGLGSQYAPFLPDEIANSVVAPKSSNLDAALRLAARLGQGDAT